MSGLEVDGVLADFGFVCDRVGEEVGEVGEEGVEGEV